MTYPRHPSSDVHWYLYSDREYRDRQRFAVFIAAPIFALLGFAFLIGAIINLSVKSISVHLIVQLLLGIALPIFSLIQSCDTLIKTSDLRSDDKGIYVQKGLSDQQLLIPYEVIDFAKRKQGRKFSGYKHQYIESFTVIPVRGIKSMMHSLVGFEYGFGLRPVIIVSRFHENYDMLLERIAAKK